MATEIVSCDVCGIRMNVVESRHDAATERDLCDKHWEGARILELESEKRKLELQIRGFQLQLDILNNQIKSHEDWRDAL